MHNIQSLFFQLQSFFSGMDSLDQQIIIIGERHIACTVLSNIHFSESYEDLRIWSVECYADFWKSLWQFSQVIHSQPYTKVCMTFQNIIHLINTQYNNSPCQTTLTCTVTQHTCNVYINLLQGLQSIFLIGRTKLTHMQCEPISAKGAVKLSSGVELLNFWDHWKCF